MRTAAIVKMFSIALATSWSFTACESSPAAPTPGADVAGPIPSPAPPGETVIRWVNIVGPQIVPIGEATQFSLIAQLSDGSTRDVTNEAYWKEGGLLWLAGPGLVKGLESGETEITGVFAQRADSRHVTVLPPGRHRLVGEVTDGGAPVNGARVDVMSGVGAPMTTYTDEGSYRLYGLSGQIILRVTKAGYQTAIRTVVVAGQLTYDIELSLLGSRADVSGVYTMTITAAGECRIGVGEGRLPEELRVRTYTAAVQQDGAKLSVTLSGASFHARGGFGGRVEPGGVVFDFTWYDGEYPYIVEQVSQSRLLIVGGRVVVTGSADRLAGMFTGVFYETEAIWSEPIALCYSTNHQFVLSR